MRYNAREFRARMKEAFEVVDAGKEVEVVTRGNVYTITKKGALKDVKCVHKEEEFKDRLVFPPDMVIWKK